MSVLDTLVTDRTGPGAYDWRDFNRVQGAVDELVERFAAHGCRVGVAQLPEWSREDIPFASQCAAYIANVRTLRDMLDQLPTTPACPESMDGWTWGAANDLEQILVDLEDALRRLELSATVPCGAAECGGDYI